MLRFLLKSTAKILLVLVPDDGPGTHTSVFAFSEDSLKNHKGYIQKKNTSPKALTNCSSFQKHQWSRNIEKCLEDKE